MNDEFSSSVERKIALKNLDSDGSSGKKKKTLANHGK